MLFKHSSKFSASIEFELRAVVDHHVGRRRTSIVAKPPFRMRHLRLHNLSNFHILKLCYVVIDYTNYFTCYLSAFFMLSPSTLTASHTSERPVCRGYGSN